jgi:hypothetical protein
VSAAPGSEKDSEPMRAGGGPPPQPEAERDEGHAEGEQGQPGEAEQDQRRPAPERNRKRRAGAAATDAREATPAAQAHLGEDHRQAQRHQHAGQQGRRRIVELQLVLLEDRRGEGLDLEEGERAELRQHVRRDEQRAAAERRPRLRQDDAEEADPAAMAERAGDLLEIGIHAAQRRRHRQVDQRHAVESEDDDRAGHALQPGAERGPGIGRDIGRQSERQARRDAPEAATRQIAALGAPRRRGADHGGTERHREREGQRVAEQLDGARPHELGEDSRRSGLPGAHHDITERQGDEPGRDDDRQQQPGMRHGMPLPSPTAKPHVK